LRTIINFDDHVAQELERVSFARQRRWLPWTTLSLALIAILALLLASIEGESLWLALLAGVLTLLSGAVWVSFEWRYRRRSRLRGQLRAGLRGQRRMAKILTLLDDRYYLINNLKLPGRADDVDHLVVGLNGIFAVETKNHRGRIFWRDGQWYQAKVSRSGRPQPEEPLRDPTRQLKRNVSHLRSCINQTDPALSRRTRLWIEGVVVFTHPAVSLDLADSVRENLPFPVLRVRDLPSHILSHEPRRSLSDSEVREIVSMFGHLEQPHFASGTGPG
jgi:hypothetical protein